MIINPEAFPQISLAISTFFLFTRNVYNLEIISLLPSYSTYAVAIKTKSDVTGHHSYASSSEDSLH